MNEKNEALALGIAGFGLGIYKEIIQPNLTARRGWGIVLGTALAYELSAPHDELLSHGVDRALESHPIATRIAIGVTALHLLNLLDDRVDPYVQIPRLAKRFVS